LTPLRIVITIGALRTKPAWGPALMLVLAGNGAGCLDDNDESIADAAATCGAADAYSPYRSTWYPSGSVTALPWHGARSSYPNGRETFDTYAASSTIECSNDKDKRTYLDVTAGCLTAAWMGDGSYHRARVELTDTGAFRSLALGHWDGDLVKWTDQHSEYRFYYSGESAGANPGFKVFARYRTEDDLYVASWRFDGVVQIQRKHCGEYTALARLEGMPPPTTHAWHRIRFDAVGDKLSLYLDDQFVLGAESATFSWGTVGIRIDGTTETYLDDWRVF
jgi:hypothetical protein